MEGVIPFEQGRLYQVINDELLLNKYRNFFINNLSYEQQKKFSSDSYSNPVPYPYYDNVEFNYGFKPIAFKEKEQKVVGEIFLQENVSKPQMSVNNSYSGISFETINMTEKVSRPFRVEIDVNDFIKDFEKVL